MGNSLREQLLKAGLVTEEQVSRAKAKSKGKPQGGRKTRARVESRKPGTRRGAGERRDRKSARPTAAAPLERRPSADDPRQRQQRRERARDFLLKHFQNTDEGDIAYHFTVGSRIRHLYVTAEQREALLSGRLVIASIGKRDFLIDRPVLEQMRSLDAEVPVHDALVAEEALSDESNVDDPYADHPVPDDLTW